MKPWSCQPCSNRVRSMFRNHMITSPLFKSFSLKHLRHRKSPKQRSSSPVEAWMTIRLGDSRDTELDCFWTEASLAFWVAGSLFCVGTVGTGTGMGTLGFFSSAWCVFLLFSMLSWATWPDGTASTFGVTFLALFLAELATSFFHERDTNIEWRLRLLSALTPAAATSASMIDAFLVAGDMERTVPMAAEEKVAVVWMQQVQRSLAAGREAAHRRSRRGWKIHLHVYLLVAQSLCSGCIPSMQSPMPTEARSRCDTLLFLRRRLVALRQANPLLTCASANEGGNQWSNHYRFACAFTSQRSSAHVGLEQRKTI